MKRGFFKLPLDLHRPLSSPIVLCASSAIAIGLFLAFSAVYYKIGFPLDDAWIHQTYARNLALRGEWAFLPGHTSGGSTSPLWSFILAMGQWLRLSPFLWSFFIGWICLWGIGVLGESSVRSIVPDYRPTLPWAGMLLTFEWHLVWAACSGMETILASFLVLLVLRILISGSRKFLILGLVAGIAVWVRPDAITLLGPVIMVMILGNRFRRGRLHSIGSLLLGFGSIFTFYLLFNLEVNGRIWPNTFYAKQAEYASYLSIPLMKRFADQCVQAFSGVGIILAPGLIWVVFSAIKRKLWDIIAWLAWLMGFVFLYSILLPATYQHGRYIIPAMAVLYILSFTGFVELVNKKAPPRLRIISMVWRISILVILGIFFFLGCFAYGRDVAVIESEMVDTAIWISQQTPPSARIAAHDIGAMGYFSDREIVDLAGLITPEVIPIIRDETMLRDFLNENNIDFLVVFPDWYPILTKGLTRVFTTVAPFSPEQGGSNMAVFSWKNP